MGNLSVHPFLMTCKVIFLDKSYQHNTRDYKTNNSIPNQMNLLTPRESTLTT